MSADHKAALEWAEQMKDLGTLDEYINLAACYLELRELAKAVCGAIGHERVKAEKALRAALREET